MHKIMHDFLRSYAQIMTISYITTQEFVHNFFACAESCVAMHKIVHKDLVCGDGSQNAGHVLTSRFVE